MTKDKDKDSDTSGAGQSKRPQPSTQAPQDSDSPSQQSDHPSQHSSQHPHGNRHPPRPKQKHVVGAVSRLHARVPSSKALHKHHPTATARPDRPGIQRRATSDAKLTSDPSSSSNPPKFPKNSSQNNLKRNRSHVDVDAAASASRSSKPQATIKRASSNPAVNKLKSSKTQVHFDLGSDQDDEWVDASGSVSPHLSRRTSVAGPSNPTSPAKTDAAASSENTVVDKETTQHKEKLTSRVLQRIPSHSAVPPKMSTETASVPARQRSPESGISRQSSTLSGTPRTVNILTGSSREDELSSRFISGPGASGDDSFYNPNATAATHQSGRVNADSNGSRRPLSVGSLGHVRRGDVSPTEDTSKSERAGGLARRAFGTPAADKSRTQQKLNLQRASSTLEPTPAHVGGIGGPSPLIGGAGDPRAGKLLDRTGMEYLVVRRYQNPVARSISRLNQLPGADGGRHIPVPNRAGPTSTTGADGPGLSQSFRDSRANDLSRPVTPRSRADAAVSSNFEAEDDDERIHGELSGSSLVDDDGTNALLRNLWENRREFASASQ